MRAELRTARKKPATTFTILLAMMLALVLGYAATALAAAGDFDASFDGDGQATTDFGSLDTAHDVAVQENGRIVAAGGSGAQAALARYNPNGSINTSFGTGGKAEIYTGDFAEARAVAVRDDGGIMVAGNVDGFGLSTFDFLLARLPSDGAYHATTTSRVDLGSEDDLAFGLALQEDGRSIAVGRTRGATAVDFALVRQHWGADATPPEVEPPDRAFPPNASPGTTGVPVKLSWSAADAGGEVVRYQLQQSTDGAAYGDVALPGPTSPAVTPDLVPGHSYRYRVRATDDNGNRSGWKYDTRFAVDASQENGPGVGYPRGAWRTQEVGGAYGGAVRYATKKGASARFSFTGTNVAWVAPKSKTRGKAAVYLDGAKVATVDLYSSRTLSRQVVFSRDDLDPASNHTLEVRGLGTAGRPWVDVDAFLALRHPDEGGAASSGRSARR